MGSQQRNDSQPPERPKPRHGFPGVALPSPSTPRQRSLFSQLGQLLKLFDLVGLQSTHSDCQIRAMGVAPVTRRAPFRLGNDRPTFAVRLEYTLGTELDADTAPFAPGAKNGYATSGTWEPCPGSIGDLNRGVRRLFLSHMPILQAFGRYMVAARNSRPIVPPVLQVSRFSRAQTSHH